MAARTPRAAMFRFSGALPKIFRRIESKVARCGIELCGTAFFHFKIGDLILDKRAKYHMRPKCPRGIGEGTIR